MMEYKFKQVMLDLEQDTVSVFVAFKESQNRWNIREYKFDAEEETDVEELLNKTKIIIDYEKAV
jgi:hypothetical protein